MDGSLTLSERKERAGGATPSHVETVERHIEASEALRKHLRTMEAVAIELRKRVSIGDDPTFALFENIAIGLAGYEDEVGAEINRLKDLRDQMDVEIRFG